MESTKRQIRFNADENTFITVVFPDKTKFGGLCIDESYNGCSGVFVKNSFFKKDLDCHLKVGKLHLIVSKIRWIKDVDKDLIRVGFEFEE